LQGKFSKQSKIQNKAMIVPISIKFYSGRENKSSKGIQFKTEL